MDRSKVYCLENSCVSYLCEKQSLSQILAWSSDCISDRVPQKDYFYFFLPRKTLEIEIAIWDVY